LEHKEILKGTTKKISTDFLFGGVDGIRIEKDPMVGAKRQKKSKRVKPFLDQGILALILKS